MHKLPPVGRFQEYAAIARQLEMERRDAAVKVEMLLRTTPRLEWGSLVGRVELQTAGALERLGVLAGEALGHDPQQALVLAEMGVAIADALPAAAYPAVTMAQLRAHALKDLGKSLRILSRYDDAMRALRSAEEILLGFGILGYDLAVIRVNIAVVYQEAGRLNESKGLLAECKRVFQGYGDHENVVRCALLEGTLLQRLGKHREAREMHLLLLAAGGLSTESRACLHKGVGFCSIELSEFDDAEANLRIGIALFREIGQPLNAITGELWRGRLLVRRGDYAAAVEHLRGVRRDLLRNAMAEEAGLCGLEIVQALLVLERNGEAEQLARKIVSEFTVAQLSARALPALAYLTDAIMARRADGTLAGQVHEFVLSLRTQPEREFHQALS